MGSRSGDIAKEGKFMNFCCQHAGLFGQWASVQVATAFTCLKNKHHLSADGSCLAILKFLHAEKPDVVRECLNMIACSPVELQKFTVAARAYCKMTCTPKTSQIRLIMLLPPLASALDVLIAESIFEWTKQYLPV